jgi:acetyl-CoA acetyltransferase
MLSTILEEEKFVKNVVVLGVGMTSFGKHLDVSLKQLCHKAVKEALEDAQCEVNEIEAIYFGNAMDGILKGQESIRGQVALYDMGFSGIPVYNVENACASSSTAFHLACMAVEAGQYQSVLVVGAEKLYHHDRNRTFQALAGAMDVETSKDSDTGSVFMDSYAKKTNEYMKKYGARSEHFAMIAEKNRLHASLNQLAQYRKRISVQEVLDSPLVASPLTRLMCSPIGDGAAVTVVSSSSFSKKKNINRAVKVKSSVLTTSTPWQEPGQRAVERAVHKAYEIAGISPQDVQLAEVHDAVSPAELFVYESLGFCEVGDGVRLVEEKATSLGGRIPVNTSGGLVSKGNPSGATGVAQICEIIWQLRGEAGDRQVEGAKIGLTENAGGRVGNDSAAVTIHIFSH